MAAAVAACALAAFDLTACDGNDAPQRHETSATAARTGNVTYSLGYATVSAPARWTKTPYRGAPATVVFPEFFLSTGPVTGPCAEPGTSTRCTTQGWFPPDTRTPADGLILLWLGIAFPTDNMPRVGDETRIGGHTARFYRGPDVSECPPGAVSAIDAYVRVQAHPIRGRYSGERIDLTTCLGPHVSKADRVAVMTMLRSLRFKTT